LSPFDALRVLRMPSAEGKDRTDGEKKFNH